LNLHKSSAIFNLESEIEEGVVIVTWIMDHPSRGKAN
jgi:hypothetical protein